MSVLTHRTAGYGVLVTGVGTDTSKPDGTLWYWGTEPTGAALSGYDVNFVDVLLDTVETVDAHSDPTTGDVRTSPFDVAMHNTDPVAEMFQYQATAEVAALTSDIADTTTDIPMSDGSLGGQVVHIDSEAIKLGTWDGSKYLSSLRGYYNTVSTAHADAQKVYDHPPYWRGRTVWLLRWYENPAIQSTDYTFRIEQRGFIKDIRESADSTRLAFSCGDSMEAMKELEINRHAVPLNPSEFGFEWEDTEAAEAGLRGQRPTSANVQFGSYVTQVRKPQTWKTDGFPIALQVGDGLFLNPTSEGFFRAALGSDPGVDEKPGEGETTVRREVDEEVWELAVYGTRIDEALSDPLVAGGAESPVPTANMADPHNVVTILEAHLRSIGQTDTEDTAAADVLQADWAAPVGEFFDFSSFDDVRERVRSYQADQFVVGWGGEPVQFWGLATNALMRPYGLFAGCGDDGMYRLRQFRLADVEDFDDAVSNTVDVIQRTDDKQRARQNALGSAVDTVTATIGGTPWSDGTTLVGKGSGEPDRPGRLAPGARWELDYRTINDDRRGIDFVSAQVLSRQIKHHYAMPRLQVRVPPPEVTGVSYDVGARIALTDLGVKSGVSDVVDNTGARVPFAGTDEQWVAQIIGRKLEMREGTYLLDLVFTNFRPGQVLRWRAPALEITDDNYLGDDDKVYCDGVSQFGFDDSDNRAFFEGDEVQVCDASMKRLGGTFEITGIGSDGTGEYLQVRTAFNLGDKTGDFIRLEALDGYDNPQPGSFTTVQRVWAFIGQEDGTLGSDDDPADIYGI